VGKGEREKKTYEQGGVKSMHSAFNEAKGVQKMKVAVERMCMQAEQQSRP
jgi:hypothetical protein